MYDKTFTISHGFFVYLYTSMESGVCTLSNIPVRKEPDSKSEMTSMLLFGETYQVVSAEGEWLHIRIHHDGYDGWINNKQHRILISPIQHPKTLRHFPFIQVHTDSGNHLLLPGSEIEQDTNGKFVMNGVSYQMENPGTALSPDPVSCARAFLNTPYLWGGRSPFGIDCSGLTQIAYKLSGINLPRDAWQQANEGSAIDFLASSVAGDLAFFDNNDGKIIHVGILLSPSQILHASGYVKINRIDNFGILNEGEKTYSHKLRIIKRYSSSNQ